jgi:hypothetical protein
MNVLPSQLNTQTNDVDEPHHRTAIVSHTLSGKPNPALIVQKGASEPQQKTMNGEHERCLGGKHRIPILLQKEHESDGR